MTFDARQLGVLAVDLKGAPDKVLQLASMVVAKTAFDIEAYAKMMAPVDVGTLRNSINTQNYPGSLTATVGPSVNYAAFVEYGTSRMRPQPYMRPAAERFEPIFHDAMYKVMSQVLG